MHTPKDYKPVHPVRIMNIPKHVPPFAQLRYSMSISDADSLNTIYRNKLKKRQQLIPYPQHSFCRI